MHSQKNLIEMKYKVFVICNVCVHIGCLLYTHLCRFVIITHYELLEAGWLLTPTVVHNHMGKKTPPR